MYFCDPHAHHNPREDIGKSLKQVPLTDGFYSPPGVSEHTSQDLTVLPSPVNGFQPYVLYSVSVKIVKS